MKSFITFEPLSDIGMALLLLFYDGIIPNKCMVVKEKVKCQGNYRTPSAFCSPFISLSLAARFPSLGLPMSLARDGWLAAPASDLTVFDSDGPPPR
jgi:hypothetical protein